MASQTETIFIAGHTGMVGGAIFRTLTARGITVDRIITRSHKELDLTDQLAVREFFAEERPSEVYLAAALVGGIYANAKYPADFIYKNLMIQANVIDSAHLCGVQKLLFVASGCIYPKHAQQPMTEEVLMTGKLESTNEPFGVSKIAGIKLCESYNRQYGRDYRSIVPANLYGPGDNYHAENSHVIPALIRRFHVAKSEGVPEVTIWGSGAPRREFLYIDDMALASVFVMNLSTTSYQANTQPAQGHINVGFGTDVSISELAMSVSRIVGYTGSISYDTTKPDGAPRKLLDSRLIKKLGWRPSVPLDEGLKAAYQEFLRLHAT